MNDIDKYYLSLVQEIATRQLANEDGDNQEQAFTRYVLDVLSEAGETENASVAFDERNLGMKRQHKINGYAIADNYETVDLFISIYGSKKSIYSTTKAEIDRAATRIINFFKKAVYDNYANEVAESSEVFEFANTLYSYEELKENLVRVNVFILTNGEYKGEIPANMDINGYKVFFRVIDIRYLYQIIVESRVPIEINFEEEGYIVPCLSAATENEDYQAYVAIIPGPSLANLYEKFGARLLEQNVRSFLQFSGKINKGIRETIKKEPHMFLAFNNGLAATADHIELDSSGRNIIKISNLQIVNGGQTTASIYYTWKKEKADISGVFVQAKISVIKRAEEFSEIVSRISRYANTQNKVNDADFTANNAHLIAFEKLSRYIMTPITENSNIQTYWFFERTRGQYKNLRLKEGFTRSRQNAFDLKYPKKQVITKVELAKYINAYEEVYDGKKIAIGPFVVVCGKEKNYSKFINSNLPDNLRSLNNIYYEDAIAKAILFITADRRYSTGHLGELKQVAVPYAISLLTIITDGKLNLYKIWKNQCLSNTLSDFIYELMRQINEFILKNSPSSHYIEWSKKEECWEKVKANIWAYDLNDIQSDLINSTDPARRCISLNQDNNDEDVTHDMGIINSIPYLLWERIAEWGRDTGCLSIYYQTAASEIAHKLRFNHQLASPERLRAINIYNIVCEKNIDLLFEADRLALEVNNATIELNYDNITIELVRNMVEWDRRRRILKDWQWRVMDKIAKGERLLDENLKRAMYENYLILQRRGFTE